MINLLCFAPARAAGKQKDAPLPPDMVKAKIIKYGTGRQARVVVRLLDGTKLKGYVSAIEADHFVVADARYGSATSVAYDQVRELKRGSAMDALQKATAIVSLGLLGVIIVSLATARD
jgi:hypothetical protein